MIYRVMVMAVGHERALPTRVSSFQVLIPASNMKTATAEQCDGFAERGGNGGRPARSELTILGATSYPGMYATPPKLYIFDRPALHVSTDVHSFTLAGSYPQPPGRHVDVLYNDQSCPRQPGMKNQSTKESDTRMWMQA